MLLNLYYEDAGVGWLIFAMLPSSLFSTTALFPLSISYISDITTKRNRTVRILWMQLSMFAGFLCGEISGGTLRDAFGYEAVYLLGMSLATLAFLYCLFFVKESTGTSSQNLKEYANAFKDVFDVSHLTQTWKTLVAKRQGYARLHLVLLIIASLFDSMLRNCKYMALVNIYCQWLLLNTKKFGSHVYPLT